MLGWRVESRPVSPAQRHRSAIRQTPTALCRRVAWGDEQFGRFITVLFVFYSSSCLDCCTPTFAAGHSLGGLIAGLACHRDQSRWAGLMMCSAALDVEMGLVMR